MLPVVYGCFGNFLQSLMAEAGVASPQGVQRMRIGGVGNGQAVLQHIDVGRGQANLNFTRTIGAGCVEHHVTVAFFLRMRRSVPFLCGYIHANHQKHHATDYCYKRFHAIDCLGVLKMKSIAKLCRNMTICKNKMFVSPNDSFMVTIVADNERFVAFMGRCLG